MNTTPTEEVIYPEEMRTCITCVHLLGKRQPEYVDKWQCTHPKNISRREVNRVTGEPVISYSHVIGDCRYSTCTGDWWGLYTPPSYRAQDTEPAGTIIPVRNTDKNSVDFKNVRKRLGIKDMTLDDL